MASQSLYRKWRSQTFSDLIGQEATVRTLLNAVREGRLAHAYLFCGPRGTGKTSAARLLAKAINCANPQNGEPCNECLSCREITAGRSPDVIEIDAASNTGVDNIRDLRENVNLLGTGGRYKVYAIDECHMLSPQAFNALLKTLEEPPPHVIFVLATTEAHKVLPTIVSRCQRFDFRRFNVRTIVARLRQVAEGEGLDLEPAAADLLARAAQGGMRDALSLLDQAIAYCGTHIDLERARTMLGLADPGAVRDLIVAVADDRPADALHQLNELVVSGADLRQVQQQLGEEWRALLLARAGADVAEVMDRTPDEARELVAIAGRFSLNELMACARVFARSETPARGPAVPQLALELALLECLTIRRTSDTGAQVAAAASLSSSGRAPVVSPVVSPVPAPVPRVAAAHAQPQPEPPQRPQPAASERMASPASAVPQVDELDLDAVASELDEMFGPVASQELMPPVLQPAPADAARRDQSDQAEALEELFEPAREPAPMAAGTDWLALARSEWAVIKKVCKQQSPSTAALLSHASPVRSEPGSPPVLIVEAQYEFHFEKLKAQKAREVVEWALEQVLGAPVRARFTLGGADRGGTATNRGGPQTRMQAQAATPASGRPESHARPPSSSSAASASSSSSTSGAAMNGTAPNGRAPQSSLNGQMGTPGATIETASRQAPPAGNGRSPNPVRLEEEARADAIVQEVQRELGAQLLDVSPSDDEREPE